MSDTENHDRAADGGLSSHALFGCLCRSNVVRVEYGDGGSEIAGILSRDGEGYWVTVPSEDVRRWVPDHAISECVSSSMVERETSGVNTTEPERDRSPLKAVIGVRFPADAPILLPNARALAQPGQENSTEGDK